MTDRTPILSLKNLSVAFGFSKDRNLLDARPLQVTDRVSFDIYPGEFFALVGESGCGKSVTAMSILRLLPYPSAKIVEGRVNFSFDGESKNLVDLSSKELQKIRGSQIACIFQEPMQALNPVLTIKKQLMEVFKFSFKLDDKTEAESEIKRMLELAGFTDVNRVLNSYPHELSGGMLQRICIVMALLPKPKLIIADEPTTALDVTVQAQVLAVLKEMAQSMGTAVLLITHNMGIVSQYAQRVAVMYAGRIVECGPVESVISKPMHPYTRGLLGAIPESHTDMEKLRPIPGSVPHPKDFVKGCRFADRCEFCSGLDESIQQQCKSQNVPPSVAVNGSLDNVATCHYACCYGVQS